MISILVFVLASILGLVLATFLFAFKDILHSALALAAVFVVNSLFFLLLAQPLLAIIQLFIMVGGIATFIFVGVASAPFENFNYTKVRRLTLTWLLLFALMVIPLNFVVFNVQQTSVFNGASIVNSLSSDSGIFYLMLLLMFGTSIGAIMLLKKTGAKKK